LLLIDELMVMMVVVVVGWQAITVNGM